MKNEDKNEKQNKTTYPIPVPESRKSYLKEKNKERGELGKYEK
jgi:hypothetical protein